uniref:RanBP2-type domain-containing protein n=1 Tax=Peronospora matthiolae TaxID=2874970 RepID=A0AAV1TKB6_9STRA
MELATEHVRLLDAGKLRLAYSSPLSTGCFASVASSKTQLLQHGNIYGLTFTATERGFVMTMNSELEACCIDYNRRRQEALDHGEGRLMMEIGNLPVSKEIQLPSIAYWIALSPDELLVAVAYANSVALFEVAHIVEAVSPAPFHTFAELRAQEIAWCSDPKSGSVAVLTLEEQVVVCTLDGAKARIETPTAASSISWSPSGKQIAVGLVDGTIEVYEQDTLQLARSLGQPECCSDASYAVHHVNWAEEELMLAGYYKRDEKNEETNALACIFEQGKWVELDEIVGFFDVENRSHQYFSTFLPDWRMFFIGCSLSADIELLVSDPEGGEWELWKPLEKYQARLSMNAEDEESFPMGFALNLNSSLPVPVDEDTFSPVPIVSCSSTEGLLVNFAFVDTTVKEVDFVKKPLPFKTTVMRIAVAVEGPKVCDPAATDGLQHPSDVTLVGKSASQNSTLLHSYGQNDENEFAGSDSESSDEEEERKEEEERARTAFHTIASDGANFILSDQFPKLFKAMGSTYSEEEHVSTLNSLEKDGKVYEADFVPWYVSWIFGDDDSDSDDEVTAPESSSAEPVKMKSKEEITAAFSRFTAKEGSWKCGVCMLDNDAEVVKCRACDASNPAAPKVETPVRVASGASIGTIGSGGFSFPVSAADASKPPSFSFAASPGTVGVANASNSSGFSFPGAVQASNLSFPSSTIASGTGFSFPPAATSITTMNSEVCTGRVGGDSSKTSSYAASAIRTDSNAIVSHEYSQNDQHGFADSGNESSDEEEEVKEEECNARAAFRSIAQEGTDYITAGQFRKLLTSLRLSHSDEQLARNISGLEKNGNVHEADFIAWYVNWIFSDSYSRYKGSATPSSLKQRTSHGYGQNDENEFAESDSESSDEEEERKEEEERARTAFHTIASDGANFILSDQFPKLFKAMGSTYSEEEHVSTLNSLEKDGKVYEADFVPWYVSWIFGDDDSDSDDEVTAPESSSAEPVKMKSKEEITAAFSRFTAKEGSWKCGVCMLDNDAEVVKCRACDASNPAAPKVETPVRVASGASIGTIGSGGFSFPVSAADASKPPSFSFAASPGTAGVANASNSSGFSFPGAVQASNLSFPSSTIASGTGFSFPPAATSATGPYSGAAEDLLDCSSVAGEVADPLNTTSKPKPPAASNSSYPPDTTSKPKPPVFGTVSTSSYPPDTASKPKPPAFGTVSTSSYPPDTASKPKPPVFGTVSTSSYPPDTASKPKPPAFGTVSTSSYPPDTASKPKPPAFGSVSTSSYPPDTASKPKPPAFGTFSTSSYPPDTASKPKPPAFGTASTSSYPPDTASKPKPPAFGTASTSSYPPDTASKPKPPAFGTVSTSSYPPDTASKPKPPAFGTFSTSSYPPDTASKPKPPAFGSGTMPKMKTSSSLFPIGTKTFGSQSKSFAPIDPSVRDSNLTSAVAPAESKNCRESAFGSDVATGAAACTSSSPFGIVPKSSSQGACLFGLAKASDSNDVSGKSNAARPGLSFSSWSSTIDPSKDHGGPEDQLPTKRTLNFEDCRALEAKTTSISLAKTNAKPLVDPAESCISIPSSPMEGQLWKLIVNFDKSLQRLNQSSTKIPSNNTELSLNCMAKVDKLRLQISDFCMAINDLDELRDQVEKDVLFVIGSDGDVHEQLEYGREMLNSFNDEALKRTLEMQPLDQRSQQTWESLKVKLAKVRKCCIELDGHLSSSKIGAAGFGAESSAHLFRVLKQTYDKSKMQYNEVFKLTEHLKELKVGGDRVHRMNGVAMTTAADSEAHSIATKADMIQMIVETGERRQDVRRNFLVLCGNVVTPRDIVSTPRRKLAALTPSSSSASPILVKATSKLMPKTRLSVASPVSSAKQSPMSVSFKNTPFKSGSKLSSLAEAMVPKEEAAKLVQTPHSTRASVSVGKASQRPSLRVPAAEMKPVSTTSSTAQSSNVFSFPKSSKEAVTSVATIAKIGDGKTGSSSSPSSNSGINVPTVKAKLGAEAIPTSALTLGGKSSPKSPPTFSFGNAKGGTQPLSTIPVTVDYKALLEKFYKVHNPSKIDGGMMDKALITYKGKEKDLFTRLFSMYVPGSTPDDVTKYLGGGPVPPKSEHGTTTVKAVKPAAESPFAASSSAQASPFTSTAAQTSPFGAPPSAFSLNPAANNASGFGGFGSTSATSSLATPTLPTSSFGKPAVDYRQKLVDFYQKYNPSKLSSVDATLQKYKGNEEKLFQNLATKYKVYVSNVSGVSVPPASPAMQPAKPNAAASPFGKPGAFSAAITSSGPSFGSTSSVGFGGAPSPVATPFGAAPTPASSPFGAPSSQSTGGFGSAGFGSGFQSTPTTTSSPFGATTAGFGATTGGGFGAVTSGGLGATPGGSNYREKLTAFYQQHNPAKLSSVDATLEKYRGREDHLFAMLEQKYLKKIPVTAPATGGFGIPSTSAFGGGGASGFGTPSSLGVASPVPAFGSASALGAVAQPAFGGTAGLGFGGMGSQMSGGFGSAAPAAGTGFGSQLSSFGGAAQQSSGFGTAARGSSGFGSGFESSAATGSFGKPAAFNSASFTQMR